MVIDTSALIAILQQEPEAEKLAGSLQQDPVRLLSSVSALEAAIVMENKKGAMGCRDLDLLLHRTQTEIVAFNAEQCEVARLAYRKYGKGRHSAGLNFGDCCSYALARVSGEPLLAKGNDFPKTDLAVIGY